MTAAAWRARAPRAFAWVSLLLGVASAWWMDHSPEHAPFVAGASVLACVGMFAQGCLTRAQSLQANAAVSAPLWHRSSRWMIMTAMQSATQQVLFFATPFYVRAACWLGLQPLFVGVLLVAAAVTFWSPSHRFVLEHPILGAIYAAFSLFAGLDVALPVLGIANDVALMVSYAAASSSAAGLIIWGLPERLLHTVSAVVCVVLGWLCLQTEAVRQAIPPAPLRLVSAAIGERMSELNLVGATEDFAVAPSEMTCFSEVWAPRGVSDTLVHAWFKDGTLKDTIALTLRGGAQEGFRTWSTKQHLGEPPSGTWRCEVRTASGQVLGAAQARVSPTLIHQ